MLELRAPEKRRTGIEIKPKVRYPDQTGAAIDFDLVGVITDAKALILNYNHCLDAFRP